MAEPTYVRARVTGVMPIRDARTRESVTEGGIVTLMVRPLGTEKVPRCPRHPRKGTLVADQTCICGATVIEPLVESGAIELLDDEPEQAEESDPDTPASGTGRRRAAKPKQQG